MADLRTDYKDDILDLTQNTQRKYRMITNDDGTVSFEDVTAYSQVGDSFGAADVNTITNALNNTEGSVRYNAETDMIQIVDAEGVWHDYASGGLAEFDLLTLTVSDFTVQNAGGSVIGTATVTTPPLKFNAVIPGGGDNSYIARFKSPILKLGSYNKLSFIGTLKLYTTAVTGFYIHNMTTDTNDFSWTSGKASTATAISGVYDLVLNPDHDYQLWFDVKTHGAHGAGYMEFEYFKLYRE